MRSAGKGSSTIYNHSSSRSMRSSWISPRNRTSRNWKNKQGKSPNSFMTWKKSIERQSKAINHKLRCWKRNACKSLCFTHPWSLTRMTWPGSKPSSWSWSRRRWRWRSRDKISKCVNCNWATWTRSTTICSKRPR